MIETLALLCQGGVSHVSCFTGCMPLTISGYSTALFATWYFIDELSLLLDAGDGVVSHLLQKTGKIKHIFISHADRDHLTGLLQLNQLNARAGLPKIYYPKDSLSFQKLEHFSKQFDRQVAATEWLAMAAGEEVEIKKGIYVCCFRNNHVKAGEGVSKSLSFLVQQSKRKLKPEYLSLPGEEIRLLRQQYGDNAVTTEVREKLLGYSGDTPVQNFHLWHNTQTLIHEATFLHSDELSETDARAGKHSVLKDVLQAASNISLQRLILGHFSVRYQPGDIDDCIRRCCKRYGIQFPVYRLLPGMFAHDILSADPVNA